MWMDAAMFVTCTALGRKVLTVVVFQSHPPQSSLTTGLGYLYLNSCVSFCSGNHVTPIGIIPA